ncbi:hypothetical protein ACJX0J_033619, partial [Zea mays]
HFNDFFLFGQYSLYIHLEYANKAQLVWLRSMKFFGIVEDLGFMIWLALFGNKKIEEKLPYKGWAKNLAGFIKREKKQHYDLIDELDKKAEITFLSLNIILRVITKTSLVNQTQH